ncbi:Hypothetical protein DHA2_150218 [Giardia duodenalis]|uniref:Uncharacterized protein n=1 Tax=Giardia intestinalis TaxID=5741 RepID=V6T882_GIAIN|nr:Hypothetical protein DHA2_150218 [Giardia intestinalis]
MSRDSHRPCVGPSRPAGRVISAITGFGPRLSWGLLETAQEGGLLLLCAPTPSGDRRAIALPRPVASVTILAASLLSAWALSGVSPQLPMSRFCPAQCEGILRAPRDRIQGCSVSQPEEGLDAAPWNCVVERIMIVH